MFRILSCFVFLLFFVVGNSIGQSFTNITESKGIVSTGEGGSGVALEDVDNDGDLDLFVFSQKDNVAYYKNNGLGHFSFQSSPGGPSAEGLFGDIDNDGDLDMFLTTGWENSRASSILKNDGRGNFSFSSGFGRVFTSGCFGDIDADGDLELFAVDGSIGNPRHALYGNDGQGNFSEITTSAGLTNLGKKSPGCTFADFDNDGDLDLYVLHGWFRIPQDYDSSGNPIPGRLGTRDGVNRLFSNDGGGHFTEIAGTAGVDNGGFNEGMAVADLNNDGYLDIYLTSAFRYEGDPDIPGQYRGDYQDVLYLNNGNMTFRRQNYGYFGHIGASSGDFNHDGWVDIVADGARHSIFHNSGNGNLTRSDTPVQGVGRGVAVGDINLDGDLDILLVGWSGTVTLLQNNQDDNDYLTINVRGPASNPFGIGAKVEVFEAGRLDNMSFLRGYDEVSSGGAYSSRNSLELEFGLNANENYDIKVSFLDGTVATQTGISSGQSIVIGAGLDVTPPQITSVVNETDRVLKILFDESIALSSSESLSSYSIDQGIVIFDATLETNKRVVRLDTSVHLNGDTYNLTIQNIEDLSGNTISSSTVSYTYEQPVDQPVPDLPIGAATKLSIDDNYPHFFVDEHGKHVFLQGISDRFTLFIWQSDTGFNWLNTLNMVANNNLNYVRVDAGFWSLGFHEVYPDQFSNPLWPWKRTGGGTASDGNPRLNFVDFDGGYFSRLKQYLQEAQNRGIYVELTFFDAEGAIGAEEWPNSVWNPTNNSNYSGVTNNDIFAQSATWNSKVKAHQENFVEKVLQETNSFSNVIYEICNEKTFTGGTGPTSGWTAHFVNYVTNRYPDKLVSVDDQYTPFNASSSSDVDMIILHGEPLTISEINGLRNKALSYNSVKPVSINENFVRNKTNFGQKDGQVNKAVRKMAWAAFTAGAYQNRYDYHYLRGGFGQRSEEPAAILDDLGNLFTLVYSTEFWDMSPNDNLIKGKPVGVEFAYCLSDPGDEYIVYMLGSTSSGQVSILLEDGKYIPRWYNPDTGQYFGSSSVIDVVGTQQVPVAVPSEGFQEDVVLYLENSGDVGVTGSASAQPISGEAPLTVQFSGSGSSQNGIITSFDWAFGEGTTSTEQNPTYTYLSPGVYIAILTVTDDNGLSNSDNVTITVTEADNIPPSIEFVRVLFSTTVEVTFSEPVDALTVENPSNYSINNGITVFSASLKNDLRTVALSTSNHAENVTYTLTVNNIRDRAKTPNSIDPNSSKTYTVSRGSISVTITCDNQYEIYINGISVGSDLSGISAWTRAEQYTAEIGPGKNVVAIKGIDTGGIAALMAEISSDEVPFAVTDGTWRISTAMQTGWQSVNFEDSNWENATVYGPYGISPWETKVENMPANTAAQWIWSSDSDSDDTVYFRFTFGENSDITPPNPPAGVTLR